MTHELLYGIILFFTNFCISTLMSSPFVAEPGNITGHSVSVPISQSSSISVTSYFRLTPCPSTRGTCSVCTPAHAQFCGTLRCELTFYVDSHLKLEGVVLGFGWICLGSIKSTQPKRSYIAKADLRCDKPAVVSPATHSSLPEASH